MTLAEQIIRDVVLRPMYSRSQPSLLATHAATTMVNFLSRQLTLQAE